MASVGESEARIPTTLEFRAAIIIKHSRSTNKLPGNVPKV